MTWKPDVMLYHSNCADGFGAAWSAWMRWGNEVRYIAASYGETPPDLAGKNVLIADFSYKATVLDKLGAIAKSIVILDHHETARDDLGIYQVLADTLHVEDVDAELDGASDTEFPIHVIASFDMEKSGARLAWEFCHDDEPAPKLIELIEDRDLWRFQFGDETRAFGLWLRSHPFDFERWEMISQELGEARGSQRIMTEAFAMKRFFDQKVAELVGMARLISIAGYTVPAANCPPAFASEVGNALLAAHPAAPFAACYSDQGKSRGFSLRSTDDRMSVSEIAKRFGGGGHRNAAGFGMPIL